MAKKRRSGQQLEKPRFVFKVFNEANNSDLNENRAKRISALLLTKLGKEVNESLAMIDVVIKCTLLDTTNILELLGAAADDFH